MWRKLIMRIGDFGPGGKPNPLQRRPAPASTSLSEAAFSPNPGNLRMFSYIPPALAGGAPLVVLLHGCGQTAAGYDAGTGWSQLAVQRGFAVLAAEQKAVNNPHTCFNWFNPEDVTRGEGEVASIAAMIEAMLTMHGLDRRRVFITGLSAGGAMTAAMLATYPELFAGGAIIAGLPFGVAADVRDALEAMRVAPLKTPRAWGDLVRAASAYAGPWPKISIWHGGLDTTVNVSNAQASVAQWADLHGLSLTNAEQEMVDGAIRLGWDDRLEVYTVPTLGHGTPIDTHEIGSAASFILDAGISSTTRIASFWGLLEKTAAKPKPSRVHIVTPPEPALPEIEAALGYGQIPSAPDKLILRALRAVGLMRKR